MWCWTPLCYKYTQIRRYSRSRASKINDSNIDVINDGENYDNDDNDVNSFYDEKKRDWLIVMDDVSGLADRFDKLASFLTVT